MSRVRQTETAVCFMEAHDLGDDDASVRWTDCPWPSVVGNAKLWVIVRDGSRFLEIFAGEEFGVVHSYSSPGGGVEVVLHGVYVFLEWEGIQVYTLMRGRMTGPAVWTPSDSESRDAGTLTIQLTVPKKPV